MMRVDCPCGHIGFFNSMDVAGEVRPRARNPHKVPSGAVGVVGKEDTLGSNCWKWTLTVCPRWAGGGR